jgi:uncharacterized protein
LDANIVIYLVEQNPTWGASATSRIAAYRAAGDEIAVGDASRLECLTGPLASGDAKRLADYANFFADPAVKMLPTTPTVWELSARIRVAHGFKPLDALHLATAVEHGCAVFVTNDVRLGRFPGIAVDVLT